MVCAGRSYPSVTLEGGTAAHEIGHYFGLYHTHYEASIGGRVCHDDHDLMSDTSEQTESGRSCHPKSPPQTCRNQFPYEAKFKDVYDPQWNVMSYYYEDCTFSFSVEQSHRMHSAVELYKNTLYTDALVLASKPGPTSMAAFDEKVCTDSFPGPTTTPISTTETSTTTTLTTATTTSTLTTVATTTAATTIATNASTSTITTATTTTATTTTTIVTTRSSTTTTVTTSSSTSTTTTVDFWQFELAQRKAAHKASANWFEVNQNDDTLSSFGNNSATDIIKSFFSYWYSDDDLNTTADDGYNVLDQDIYSDISTGQTYGTLGMWTGWTRLASEVFPDENRPGSCQNGTVDYCGVAYYGQECQCEASCTFFGDCCSDYKTICDFKVEAMAIDVSNTLVTPPPLTKNGRRQRGNTARHAGPDTAHHAGPYAGAPLPESDVYGELREAGNAASEPDRAEAETGDAEPKASHVETEARGAEPKTGDAQTEARDAEPAADARTAGLNKGRVRHHPPTASAPHLDLHRNPYM